MGAGDFHGRVRDGIGCRLPAMATRSSSLSLFLGWCRFGVLCELCWCLCMVGVVEIFKFYRVISTG